MRQRKKYNKGQCCIPAYLGNSSSAWLPSPYLEYPSQLQSCREAGVGNNTVKVKAKRGRPPSKPPTEELIRKRRKVCETYSYISPL